MSVARAFQLKFGVAAAAGVLALGGGGWLAAAHSWPTAAAFRSAPLPVVTEARAFEVATTSPPDLAEVRRRSEATLALRPGDSVAWARLAWVARQEGDLRRMRAMLGRTYDVAPHGPEVTPWRLRFAFGAWGDLTPELRRQAIAELRVARRAWPAAVQKADPDIRDPAGRLAWTLTVQ